MIDLAMSRPAQRGIQITTFDDALKFAQAISRTSFAPKGSTPEGLVIAMQFGFELGLNPLQAIQSIAVINGKPSVYGDAALGLVQSHPSYEGMREWIEGDNGNATAHCAVKRRGQEEQVRTFSVADAKRAGLWGKPGPWQAYPQRMLQMRARGFALRDTFADALKGLITSEEAMDYPVQNETTTPRPALPHPAGRQGTGAPERNAQARASRPLAYRSLGDRARNDPPAPSPEDAAPTSDPAPAPQREPGDDDPNEVGPTSRRDSLVEEIKAVYADYKRLGGDKPWSTWIKGNPREALEETLDLALHAMVDARNALESK